MNTLCWISLRVMKIHLTLEYVAKYTCTSGLKHALPTGTKGCQSNLPGTKGCQSKLTGTVVGREVVCHRC